MNRSLGAPVALTMFGLLVSPAGAQNEPASTTEFVRDLVAQLDRDAWLERDLATVELGQLHPDIGLEHIEVFISDPNLSPEQRARLMDAAVERYLAHPKGALGVQFGTIQVGAIEVQPIDDDPRFPASALLEDGDAIAMIDGEVVEGSFSLRAQILSREPGELMPTTILRAGRLIDLDLELGSFETLTGAARMDPELAQAALRLRWARRGIELPGDDRIGGAIRLDEWLSAAFPEGTRPDARSPDRRLRTGLIADNGQPRESGYGGGTPGIDPWESAAAMRRGALANTLGLAQERLEVLESRKQLLARRAAESGVASEDDLEQVRTTIAELRAHIGELEAELGSDPDATP